MTKIVLESFCSENLTIDQFYKRNSSILAGKSKTD